MRGAEVGGAAAGSGGHHVDAELRRGRAPGSCTGPRTGSGRGPRRGRRRGRPPPSGRASGRVPRRGRTVLPGRARRRDEGLGVGVPVGDGAGVLPAVAAGRGRATRGRRGRVLAGRLGQVGGRPGAPAAQRAVHGPGDEREHAEAGGQRDDPAPPVDIDLTCAFGLVSGTARHASSMRRKPALTLATRRKGGALLQVGHRSRSAFGQTRAGSSGKPAPARRQLPPARGDVRGSRRHGDCGPGDCPRTASDSTVPGRSWTGTPPISGTCRGAGPGHAVGRPGQRDHAAADARRPGAARSTRPGWPGGRRPRRWPPSPAGDAVRAWGRLGYPRRAIRLHATAQALVERHGGEVPRVGGRAAGAARHRLLHGRRGRPASRSGSGTRCWTPTCGRVLARLVSGRELPPPSPSAAERRLAESLLPEEPAVAARWSVAVMELGALVCTAARPRCARCPVAAGCAWRRAGHPADGGPRRTQKYEGTDRQCRGRLLAVLRDCAGPGAGFPARGGLGGPAAAQPGPGRPGGGRPGGPAAGRAVRAARNASRPPATR